MNPETPKLNIVSKPEKVFRDERKNKKEVFLGFSNELENDHPNKEKAKKRLEVFDKEMNIQIGTLYFNEVENSFEIKEVAIDSKYSGNEAGLNLYKELIELGKNKNLESIKSDCVVQGGAIAVWKKLQDEGYIININPKIKEKYEEFLKIYGEGKYFKEFLTVPSDESVFELLIK